VTWSADDQTSQVTTLDQHYACASDVAQSTDTLLLCGVSRDVSAASNVAPPCIKVFSRQTEQGQPGWVKQGDILRGMMKIVTCARAFDGEKGGDFATGEQLPAALPARPQRDCLCMYDIGNSPTLETLQPSAQYWEHQEIITCLAVHPQDPSQVFSGSKDCTIKLWDKRMQVSAASMGGTLPGGAKVGHTQMITTLDVFGSTIVSGSLDQTVRVWDLRNMRADRGPLKEFKLEMGAILKISACKAGQVAGQDGLIAVSTVQGLAVLRTLDSTVVRASPPAGRAKVSPYHDIKWTPRGVWAGGEDKVLDLYELVATR